MGGTDWTAFYVIYIKCYYFESFGVQSDKYLLGELPEKLIYHNYKIQDLNSNLCGSFCLYPFYLMERMKCYDIILKMCFGLSNMPQRYLESLQIILKIKLKLVFLYKIFI